jgi:drug/metabolite transporter (DMT)-like permease
MPYSVIVLMMCSAFLSASWNALIKGAGDKLFMIILFNAAAGVLGALVLPFLPVPAPASWPFISATALLSVVYYAGVARAYHVADLSLTFPLMRGMAPLLVAMSSRMVVGERLSAGAWLGVGLICCGILGLAATALERHGKGVALALCNAAVVAAYTLTDGVGVRRSGSLVAYGLWVYILTALPMVAWALAVHRRAFVRYAAAKAPIVLTGGILSIAIYTTTLWGMTVAPVAVVAALRETSILFAVALSAFVLKEKVGLRRAVLACAIAGGAVALRLA